MKTHCTETTMNVKALGRRTVLADFDGGQITSDAGAVLLEQVDRRINLLSRFGRCFRDHRDPGQLEHPVLDLVRQRIFGLALGYEDLNDHDELSRDPMLATAVGKADPTGQSRRRKRDKGRALAGKSTLNRVELTPEHVSPDARYHKVALDFDATERLFVDIFLESFTQPPAEIVLDLDTTDDPLYGQQEGRFFNAYYKEYVYLPLYVFCGRHLLVARLRTADHDGTDDTVRVLAWLIAIIRQRWPGTRIIVRGDSGFCREPIMSFCEEQPGVHYVLGLPRNSRLEDILRGELVQAKALYQETGEPARVFKDFTYRTQETWSRERRVVGKAEHLADGPNPRFVVTSLPADEYDARSLYEDVYCARGEMENRIKEQQLCLFADRTSTATIRGNQIRLWFSSMAYVLVSALRRLGLAGTQLANARCDTIRLKLLKIGAAIKVTVRHVWISMSSSYPLHELFRQVLGRLQAVPLRC